MESITRRLKEYIKDCINRGFSSGEIRDYLIKKNYPKSRIKNITKTVSREIERSFFFKSIICAIPFLLVVLLHLFFEIPGIIFFLALSASLLSLISVNKNAKGVILLILASFFISEILFVKYGAIYGLILYSIFLAALLLVLVFRNFRKEIRTLLIATMILPIVRIIGSLMPIEGLSFLSRVTVVYVIMAIAAFIIFLNVGIKNISKKKGFSFLPLILILGTVLGYVEFLILKPEAIFTSLSAQNILLGFLVMFAVTGFVEEFVFRGILQNVFLKVFNKLKALLFSNILFVTMHLVWLNTLEIIFVFVVGLLHGIIYLKTRNLFLIAALHGAINFFLFIVYPILL